MTSDKRSEQSLRLENFEGRTWEEWDRECERVRGSNNNHLLNGDLNTEVKQLKRSELELFGFEPETEHVYLIICKYCDRPFKPQALRQHLETFHRDEPGVLEKMTSSSPYRSHRINSNLKSKSNCKRYPNNRHRSPTSKPTTGLVSTNRLMEINQDHKNKPKNKSATRKPTTKTTSENKKQTENNKLFKAASKNGLPLIKPTKKPSCTNDTPELVFKSSSKSSLRHRRNGYNPPVNDVIKIFPPTSNEPVRQETISNASQHSQVMKTSPALPVKPPKAKMIPLKERKYDPDKHCGVRSSSQNSPCTRSLTCKTHTRKEKRKVPGRSKTYDELLHARANQKLASTNSVVMATTSSQPPPAPSTVSHFNLVSQQSASSIGTLSNQSSPDLHPVGRGDSFVSEITPLNRPDHLFPRIFQNKRCVDCWPDDDVNIDHMTSYHLSNLLTEHPRPLVEPDFDLLQSLKLSRQQRHSITFPNKLKHETSNLFTSLPFTPLPALTSASNQSTPSKLFTSSTVNLPKSSKSRSRKRGLEIENGRRTSNSSKNLTGVVTSKRGKLTVSAPITVQQQHNLTTRRDVIAHQTSSQLPDDVTSSSNKSNSISVCVRSGVSRPTALAALLAEPGPVQSRTSSTFKRPAKSLPQNTAVTRNLKSHVINYTPSDSRAPQVTKSRKIAKNRRASNTKPKATSSSLGDFSNGDVTSLYSDSRNLVTVSSEEGSLDYPLMDLVDSFEKCSSFQPPTNRQSSSSGNDSNWQIGFSISGTSSSSPDPLSVIKKEAINDDDVICLQNSELLMVTRQPTELASKVNQQTINNFNNNSSNTFTISMNPASRLTSFNDVTTHHHGNATTTNRAQTISIGSSHTLANHIESPGEAAMLRHAHEMTSQQPGDGNLYENLPNYFDLSDGLSHAL